MNVPRHAVCLLPCLYAGVELVVADSTRAFGRHTHEQFGIGLIARGGQKSASGRGTVEAGAGELITVNPGEVHDGAPLGHEGRAWSMLYLAPALVDDLAADIGEGRAGFEFHQPAFRDERVAGLFPLLFKTLTGASADAGELQTDQLLLMLLSSLLRPAPERSVPAGIAAARTLIDDDPAAEVTLHALAREAGLSRHQLLRGFARATGLTPHAYLMQRRLHRARGLIAAGSALADAAVASGFADQSHMTRLFVRSFGIGPGAYARALR